MNDIEAAVVKAWLDCADPHKGSLTGFACGYRSALAHAARGEGEDIEERNRRWQFDAVKRALDTGEEPHAIRGYHDKYLNEYALTLRRVAAAARNEKKWLAAEREGLPPVTVHFYCDGCDGNGDVMGEPCARCKGTGHEPIRPARRAKGGGR